MTRRLIQERAGVRVFVRQTPDGPVFETESDPGRLYDENNDLQNSSRRKSKLAQFQRVGRFHPGHVYFWLQEDRIPFTQYRHWHPSEKRAYIMRKLRDPDNMKLRTVSGRI